MARPNMAGMVVDVPERSRVEIRVGDETAGFIE
jgi:hypothetical protein